jgi:hypothetical protein
MDTVSSVPTAVRHAKQPTELQLTSARRATQDTVLPLTELASLATQAAAPVNSPEMQAHASHAKKTQLSL